MSTNPEALRRHPEFDGCLRPETDIRSRLRVLATVRRWNAPSLSA